MFPVKVIRQHNDVRRRDRLLSSVALCALMGAPAAAQTRPTGGAFVAGAGSIA
jgi:hypothetical protein